ncbi:Hpt domain-containing protein [Emcibacter nanhaiensis]|uniref:Hpt domain-containing protein n=1 Tax=Emcibacter nanhaiensis TaxID=1505037 RepID=A0A501PP60_9PROT|nr:Hpt domain-containing protein [Emcibacter nanhaiensis]TPD61551.1 Hpt domain-containing protein [Emcibacter nanhaiensis]
MHHNSKKLDTDQLEQMLGGVNKTQVAPIVEELFRDFSERRAILAAAIQDRDYKSCRIQAHSLKSLSQTFGFEALNQLARKLEEACRNNDDRDIEQIAQGVFDLMGASKEALTLYLAEKGR